MRAHVGKRSMEPSQGLGTPEVLARSSCLRGLYRCYGAPIKVILRAGILAGGGPRMPMSACNLASETDSAAKLCFRNMFQLDAAHVL